MLLDEVLKRFPDTTEKEWRRRPNGSLQHRTAVVREGITWGTGVWVGPDAFVGEAVTLGAFVVVGTKASVGYGCVLGDSVELRDGSKIHGCIVVPEGVIVSPGAEFTNTPLMILGASEHTPYHSGPRMMGVGCEVHPIAFWKKNIDPIGARHGYDADQIEEYKLYLKLIAARDKKVFP